jgi:hypothetical protein
MKMLKITIENDETLEAFAARVQQLTGHKWYVHNALDERCNVMPIDLTTHRGHTLALGLEFDAWAGSYDLKLVSGRVKYNKYGMHLQPQITVLLSLTSSSSEDEAEQLREDLVRALGGDVS